MRAVRHIEACTQDGLLVRLVSRGTGCCETHMYGTTHTQQETCHVFVKAGSIPGPEARYLEARDDDRAA
jgi:hypothetical protein